MRDDDRTNLWTLLSRIEKDVEEQASEYIHLDKDAGEVQDWLHELADSTVPVMNASLLECVLNDLTLGFPDDMSDADNVYEIIGRSIYDRLRERAEEVWIRLKDQVDMSVESRQEQGESLYRVALVRKVVQHRTIDIVADSEESAMREAKKEADKPFHDEWHQISYEKSNAYDAVNVDDAYRAGKPVPEV